MRNRIAAFLALPVDKLDAASLRARLAEIGSLEGASSGAADGRRPA